MPPPRHAFQRRLFLRLHITQDPEVGALVVWAKRLAEADVPAEAAGMGEAHEFGDAEGCEGGFEEGEEGFEIMRGDGEGEVVDGHFGFGGWGLAVVMGDYGSGGCSMEGLGTVDEMISRVLR